MEPINREFKAVVQDISHIYLGAQMSVEELLSYEDVPFKVKAIFNKYFSSEDKRGMKVCDILSGIDKDDFIYQVVKQLRLKFKVGTYVEKRGKETYKSGTYDLDSFLDIHQKGEKCFDEEIVFNKLALYAFST